MRRALVAMGAVIVVLGVLDAAWLGTMVPAVYRPQLGTLLADRPVWPAAIGFYLLYAAGLLVLVVLPVLAGDRPGREAALRGAVLGLVAYGTYDVTNLATLRDWPVVLTLIDMAWGTLLTATAAFVSVQAARRFG